LYLAFNVQLQTHFYFISFYFIYLLHFIEIYIFKTIHTISKNWLLQTCFELISKFGVENRFLDRFFKASNNTAILWWLINSAFWSFNAERQFNSPFGAELESKTPTSTRLNAWRCAELNAKYDLHTLPLLVWTWTTTCAMRWTRHNAGAFNLNASVELHASYICYLTIN